MNGDKRPPAGSKLREYAGRAMDTVRAQARKRLLTRQPGRRGGIR